MMGPSTLMSAKRPAVCGPLMAKDLDAVDMAMVGWNRLARALPREFLEGKKLEASMIQILNQCYLFTWAALEVC